MYNDMYQGRVFHLGGLKKVFWAQIITIIGVVLSSIGSNLADESAVGGVFSLASLIVFIVALVMNFMGLAELKTVCERFHKAQKNFIWLVVLDVIGVIIAVIGLVAMFGMVFTAATADATTDLSSVLATGGVGLFVFVLAGILGIIAAIMGLLYYWNLMHGCAFVAETCGDLELAGKCRRSGKTYVILDIIEAVLLVVGVIVLIAGVVGSAAQTDFTDYTTENTSAFATQMLGASMGGLVMLLLGLLVGIALFIVWIIMMVRIHAVYTTFEGRPMDPPQAPMGGYGGPAAGYGGYGAPTGGYTAPAEPEIIQSVTPMNDDSQNREQ